MILVSHVIIKSWWGNKVDKVRRAAGSGCKPEVQKRSQGEGDTFRRKSGSTLLGRRSQESSGSWVGVTERSVALEAKSWEWKADVGKSETLGEGQEDTLCMKFGSQGLGHWWMRIAGNWPAHLCQKIRQVQVRNQLGVPWDWWEPFLFAGHCWCKQPSLFSTSAHAVLSSDLRN